LEILMPATVLVPMGDLVILGAPGDLAAGKLFPASYRCDRTG